MSVSERAKDGSERRVVIAGGQRGEVAVCRVTRQANMRRENESSALKISLVSFCNIRE